LNEITLLPPDIAKRSHSKNEIVLSLEDVLPSIFVLTSKGLAVVNWEGWILTADGKHGFTFLQGGEILA